MSKIIPLLLFSLCCKLFIGTALLTAAEPVEPMPNEKNALQGQWLVTSFTRGNEANEGILKLELTFHFTEAGVTITSATNKDFPTLKRLTKIVTNTQPKLLDLAENEADFASGKSVHEGIYQIEGDELTWAFTQQGLFEPAKGQRPADFDGSKESNLIVIKFKKQPAP